MSGMGAQDCWVLCDECDEPITASRPGIVQFPRGLVPPKDVTPHFVHKGDCDRDRAASWNDLNAFLAVLGRCLSHDLPDEETQRGGRVENP